MNKVHSRRARASALVAAMTVAGLLAGQTGAAHGAGGTRTDEPGTVTMPPPEPVRVATFNTASFQSLDGAVADVQQVADRGADVIALQEMSSAIRRSAVAAALVSCETCVYDMYVAPGGAVPAGTPILYRKDRFTLVSAGSRQVTEATYVGPRGAGPSTIRPKFVNWVRLRDGLTTRQFYVLNNHAVPSVQAPDGGPNDNRRRLAIYRKHMDGLKALVAELQAAKRAPVFVVGDFNVNFRKDRVVASPLFPYVNMGQVAGRASYEVLGEPEEGSHVLPSGFDKRLIDQVYLIARGMQPTGQQILTEVSSDHRPVVVESALPYKAKLYRSPTRR